MNQKSLDKNKTKELEWEMRLENILGNRKDIIDKLVGKIPDEQVIESLKYFDETKRQLDELISALLTQQRTELLEEIKKIEKEYSPYIRNHGLPEHQPLTLTNANREGYNQAIKDITNLLNKKDEAK